MQGTINSDVELFTELIYELTRQSRKKNHCCQHAFETSGAFLLGSIFVLSIIFDSKIELEYFLTPTFAKRNHVGGKV